MEPIKPINPTPSAPSPNTPPSAPVGSLNSMPPATGSAGNNPSNTGQNNSGIQPTKPGWFSHIKGISSFVAFIGGVLLAAFLINQFVFQSYFVEGTSMVPTLQNNDRLIIEKVGKTIDQVQGKGYLPSRGDIVVLDSTIITANGSVEQLIKRVIGLPGDKIHIEDGIVTVSNQKEPNGFNVDERLGLDIEPTYSSGPLDFSVPEGQVFVMGDNRTQNGSHDSRAFGPVSTKDLEGRLWARILPINQAKVFSTPDS